MTMKSLDEVKKEVPLYTPEEIKEILQQKWTIHSQEKLYRSAFALIQQLELQNTELLKKVEMLTAELRDAKANRQHTIEIAKRQKEQIKKLKNVIVRLNNERAHRDDQCGHAGPGIRDNY